MSEEKIEDSLATKPNSKALFASQYPIPIVHYSPSIMAKLSQTKQRKWNKFISLIPSLEQLGVRVILVPLSLDKTNNTWWVDYETSYIRRFNLNPDNKPFMSCVIRINDNGRCLPDQPLAIQHNNIKHKLKKQVLAILNYKWFTWDGTQRHVMEIVL